MIFHSIGPETMSEDEHAIGRAYQTWLTPLLGAFPVVVAAFADTKWVIAAGFAVTLPLLHEIGGRL